MNPEQYLALTHETLTSAREARAKTDPNQSPDFEVISLLGPGEVALSALLREFLDPKGSHAQDRAFLDLFIQGLYGSDLVPKWATSWQSAEVKLEVKTDSIKRFDRRIDIVIELAIGQGRKAALAIENKPWTHDPPNQLRDYLEHLGVRYPSSHTLVYLTGETGRLPSEESISPEAAAKAVQEGRLLYCDYQKLRHWLCRCKAECKSSDVISFIEIFERYIGKTFLGERNMWERKQIANDAAQSAEGVEMALEVALAEGRIKEILIAELRKDLEYAGPIHGWTVAGNFDLTKYPVFFQVELQKCPGYVVAFAFDNPGGTNFYYGFRRDVQKHAVEDHMRQSLDSEFGLKGIQDKNWYWYAYFPADIREWTSSSKPWVHIKNGMMAKWMIETISRIQAALANSYHH